MVQIIGGFFFFFNRHLRNRSESNRSIIKLDLRYNHTNAYYQRNKYKKYGYSYLIGMMPRFIRTDWFLRRLDYEICFWWVVRGSRSTHFPGHVVTESCAHCDTLCETVVCSIFFAGVPPSGIHAPRSIIVEDATAATGRTSGVFAPNNYLSVSMGMKMTIYC